MGTPFELQLPDPVDAIDNAEAGAADPVDEDGAGVVHRSHGPLLTGRQLAVGIVHLDELHTTANGVEVPNPCDHLPAGKCAVNLHKVRPLRF